SETPAGDDGVQAKSIAEQQTEELRIPTEEKEDATTAWQRQEEQKAWEESERQRRQDLFVAYQKAEAEKRQTEEDRKRKEAAKKKRKSDPDDDDDDGRIPLWKKGAVGAAALIVAYFVVSFVWGIIATQRAMMKPETVAVTGRVMSRGRPVEAVVRFYPQQ